jgi:hypothetical protein
MQETTGPVKALGSCMELAIDSGREELEQALRRLNRAVVGFKIEAGVKSGKPVIETPLTRELDKQIGQLEQIRLAYGLTPGDEERNT